MTACYEVQGLQGLQMKPSVKNATARLLETAVNQEHGKYLCYEVHIQQGTRGDFCIQQAAPAKDESVCRSDTVIVFLAAAAFELLT